ncbi:MAG: CRISPR-associated endonuclease Cas1 [Candidatus Nanoarchaeia archaeon]|nr:CRISPR-associated endonuclease Cas1 [Candidatus Nanoarchaeia archaeon]
MQVIINQFGTFVGKKENRFTIVYKDVKDEHSADKVDQIKILCASSISSEAVKLAVNNNIDIVFLGKFGEPYARIYPCKLGGTTLTRKEQAKAYLNDKGPFLVKKFLEAKLKNQLFHLKRLNKTREGAFLSEIAKIEANLGNFSEFPTGDMDKIRNNYLGYEGNSAAIYFSCLNQIAKFSNRDPKSRDIFNIALNYGYGILYSEIERACIVAGLDPYLGFLHTDRYGKPSMVLDLIEQFRPIIDKAILKLFVQKRVDIKDLEMVEQQIVLTKEGRSKIISEVLESLNLQMSYRGKNLSVMQIIQEQAREVARFIVGQSENYEPFVWRE